MSFYKEPWLNLLKSKWKQYWMITIDDHRISFRSKTSGYLIGIMVAFIFTIINGIIFGVGWDDQFDMGTWLVLGGFTIWVPTSGLILPVIIGFLIHYLGIRRRITFEGDAEILRIFDRKFGKSSIPCVIDRRDIRILQIIRRRLGLKSISIILFGTHMVFMMTNGLSLLLNPLNFGYGIGNALSFTIAGCIDIMFLGLITFAPHTVIEIHTEKEIYRISFYYREKGREIIQGLEKLLEIPVHLTNSHVITSKEIKFMQSGWIETIMGIILIGLAILSFVCKIFVGNILRYALILLGLLLIETGIKHVYFKKSDRRIAMMINDSISGKLLFKNNLTLEQETDVILHSETRELRIVRRSLWITPLMKLLTWIISALLGWTTAIWYRFLPYGDLPISLIGKTILNMGLTTITLTFLIALSLRTGSFLEIRGKTGKLAVSTFPLNIRNGEGNIDGKSRIMKDRIGYSAIIIISFFTGIGLARLF